MNLMTVGSNVPVMKVQTAWGTGRG
jgi:hypothetical protein